MAIYISEELTVGKLFVIGIGPGNDGLLTFQAREAIKACELLCGYHVYTELIKKYFPDKEYYETPMGQELERCRYACRQASAGRITGMLSSGDAGIYGMAGPVLEMAEEFGIEAEVVPGITAAVSGAAKLGAPLMNDFCVISLSDLLTPWEVIEKRLRGASAADFTIVIYNPMSKGRPENLKRGCDIILEVKSPRTACGYVRNVGREGEEVRTLTLEELRETELDMFTTVFIGASNTYISGGRLITGRGYR